MKIFINMVLGVVAKKLDGHKSKIGGWSLILLGIVGVVSNMWPDLGLIDMDLEAAMASIGFGWTALGYGGKLEKIKTEIVKSTTLAQVDGGCDKVEG